MSPPPSLPLLAEATAVAAAAWLPVILVWLRQTRVRGLPLRPFWVALCLAIGCSLVAFAATAVPLALHGLAAATLASLAYLFWRQRPTYGRRRGLPPGTLRPLDPGFWRDHLALAAAVRRHGPVLKAQPGLEPFVCVAGLDLGRSLLRDHGDALASRTWAATTEVPGGFLRFRRGEEHRRVRQPIAAAMRGDLVAANETALRALTRRGLARLDRPDPLAQRVALRDLAEAWLALTLLGIGEDEPLLPRLRAAMPAPEEPDRTPISGRLRPGTTAVGIALLRDRPVPSADCVIGRVAGSSPLDDDLLGNLFLMLQLGAFDLGSLLRWLLYYLANRPALMARLRSGPAAERAALARACVRESLRLDQAEAVMRKATADIRFAGFTIPRGWGVRICLREPHRDPKHFDRPHEFRPERFLEAPPPSSAYAPLGLGTHSCVAADQVIELGRLFIEELAGAFTLDVLGDGPRALGVYHWEPAPTFAARLRPAARPERDAEIRRPAPGPKETDPAARSRSR